MKTKFLAKVVFYSNMCVCSYLCDESGHGHLSSNDSAKWDAKANFQDICVITKYNKIKCKKANMKKKIHV